MTVRLSQTLGTLPIYIPGETVPGSIKLASNESPYPPLPSVRARIAESALTVNRYPDSFSTQLCVRIATKLGVEQSQVVVGCGSVSLCAQLVRACVDPGDEVIYAWRSFEGYPIVTVLGGAVSVQVPLRDFTHDLDAMAARITDRTRVIFVCNPNNPTGTIVGRNALLAFLAQVPTNVVVALDEAYFEFVSDPDAVNGLSLLAQYPNLVVLRTFSKAYGLAGLRVGYAVTADAAIATALRQTQLPFVVTQISQDAASASLELRAQQELLERVAEVVGERERVRAELLRLGYVVPVSHGNFVWLALAEHTADWAQGCADRKLIGRPFSGEGVRVTIGTPEENDRLLEAAQELTRV